jgi:hypothetical protein
MDLYPPILESTDLQQAAEISSNNKTLNARLLARVLTGCHYT